MHIPRHNELSSAAAAMYCDLYAALSWPRHSHLPAHTNSTPAHYLCVTPHLHCAARWQAVYRVIPDERPLIEQTLKELCDAESCSLVVTTGGTGPAPRDVTPEATEAVRQAWGTDTTTSASH